MGTFRSSQSGVEMQQRGNYVRYDVIHRRRNDFNGLFVLNIGLNYKRLHLA